MISLLHHAGFEMPGLNPEFCGQVGKLSHSLPCVCILCLFACVCWCPRLEENMKSLSAADTGSPSTSVSASSFCFFETGFY